MLSVSSDTTLALDGLRMNSLQRVILADQIHINKTKLWK